MATPATNYKLDRIGAVASMVCAVHCLLVGVALSVLSVLGLGFLGSRTAEMVFFSVAIFVGGLAVYAGFRHHKSYVPAIVFACGIVLVAISHFFLRNHNHQAAQEDPLTTVLSVCGGLCLVAFHVVNTRLSRACHGGCHCPHHEGRDAAGSSE